MINISLSLSLSLSVLYYGKETLTTSNASHILSQIHGYIRLGIEFLGLCSGMPAARKHGINVKVVMTNVA